MREVLAHGWLGVERGQAPFAAAVYDHNHRRLSLAYNTCRSETALSRHGEVNAIDAACKRLQKTDLSRCILVTTGEPCAMCAATAAMARVDAIVFGAPIATIVEAGFSSLKTPCAEVLTAVGSSASLIGPIFESPCRAFLLQDKSVD